MTVKGEELTVKGEFSTGNIYTDKDLLIGYNNGFSPAEKVIDADAPLFRMVFAVKGSVNYTNKGEKKPFVSISNQQHNLALINPGELMVKFNPAGQNEIICITLSPAFLLKYLPVQHPGCRNLLTGMENNGPALFSKENMYITPEINAILYSLENSPHKGFYGRLFLESKVIELLVLQLSQFEHLQKNSSPNRLTSDALAKVYQVREIMLNNLESQFSLRTLAHMVGTNEFNLKKHFKVAFGTTVFGYLNQHKMEQAKTLLMQGGSKIAEISVKMGYKHATHFTSAFKRYFGYLPNKIKMFWLFLDPEFFLSELLVYMSEA